MLFRRRLQVGRLTRWRAGARLQSEQRTLCACPRKNNRHRHLVFQFGRSGQKSGRHMPRTLAAKTERSTIVRSSICKWFRRARGATAPDHDRASSLRRARRPFTRHLAIRTLQGRLPHMCFFVNAWHGVDPRISVDPHPLDCNDALILPHRANPVGIFGNHTSRLSSVLLLRPDIVN
jgi:hypothetical protein